MSGEFLHTQMSVYILLRCCVLSCCHLQLFATTMPVACQTDLSMVFSRQEYWSGWPFPTPGDLPDPGIEPTSLVSPALAGGFSTTEPAAAAAAKSHQSCPTLCDPIDGSPAGSPVPGILQARTLEWAAISFSDAWKWKVKVKSLSHVRLLATPWTVAYQAPPSMGFPRQEYWSGVPLPSPLGSPFIQKATVFLYISNKILENEHLKIQRI